MSGWIQAAMQQDTIGEWRLDIIISGALENPVQTGFLKNVRGKNFFHVNDRVNRYYAFR